MYCRLQQPIVHSINDFYPHSALGLHSIQSTICNPQPVHHQNFREADASFIRNSNLKPPPPPCSRLLASSPHPVKTQLLGRYLGPPRICITVEIPNYCGIALNCLEPWQQGPKSGSRRGQQWHYGTNSRRPCHLRPSGNHSSPGIVAYRCPWLHLAVHRSRLGRGRDRRVQLNFS